MEGQAQQKRYVEAASVEGALPTDQTVQDGANRGRTSTRGSRNSRRNFKRGARFSTSSNRGSRAGSRSSEGDMRGSHLSKTSSEEKNDPLWKEAYFRDSGSEMRHVPGLRFITGDLHALSDYVSAVYTSLCASSSAFAKRVPESSLMYYCSILGYCRMLYIQHMNGKYLSNPELEFINQIRLGRYVAPEPISDMINGLGNTITPGGEIVDYFIKPVAYLTAAAIPGWFGNFNANTHYYYASIPSPAVAFYRIMMDLDPQTIGDYNFPEIITPIEENHGYPTRNAIGYAPAIRLRGEQTAFLNACGVYSGVIVNSDNDRIILVISLLRAVSVELAQTKIFQLNPINLETNRGSQAQLVLDVTAASATYPLVGYRLQKEGILKGTLHELLPGKLSHPGESFVYRLWRDPITSTLYRSTEEIQREREDRLYKKITAIRDGKINRASSEGNISADSAEQRDLELEQIFEEMRRFDIQAEYQVQRHWWCTYQFNNFLEVPAEWQLTRNALRSAPMCLNSRDFESVSFDLSTRIKRITEAFFSR